VGCILGADPSKGRIQVHILGVQSTDASSTSPNEAGQFFFKNVPNGDYVLLATQEAKPLGMTTIVLPLHHVVVMDLEALKVFPYAEW
jgi:hypothetical protein